MAHHNGLGDFEAEETECLLEFAVHRKRCATAQRHVKTMVRTERGDSSDGLRRTLPDP